MCYFCSKASLAIACHTGPMKMGPFDVQDRSCHLKQSVSPYFITNCPKPQDHLSCKTKKSRKSSNLKNYNSVTNFSFYKSHLGSVEKKHTYKNDHHQRSWLFPVSASSGRLSMLLPTFFVFFNSWRKYLNRRTVREKAKIWKNPRRVDGYDKRWTVRQYHLICLLLYCF